LDSAHQANRPVLPLNFIYFLPKYFGLYIEYFVSKTSFCGVILKNFSEFSIFLFADLVSMEAQRFLTYSPGDL
jgi:hypothetical protein